MPSSIGPAVGAVSPQSSEKGYGVRTRLSGLGLTLIALGPPVVIVAGIVLTALAVIDLVRDSSAEVTAVAGIVENRISPQIEKIEQAFDRLGAPLSQLKDHIEGAMAALNQLSSVRIARGQWGSTPTVHVKIPPNDLQVGSVSVDVPFVGTVSKSLGTIDNGALFNQATPSLPIPPEPFVLSMEPLHQALAPLGPNGAVGNAIKAAENAVDGAIGEIGKLRQPILAIRDGVVGALAPLRAVIGPIVTAVFVVVIALVAQVLLYVAGVLVLVRSRPAEFMGALIGRGPLGVLGYSYRALLQSGFVMTFGCKSTPPRERLIEDLRTKAERLQTEIATLRADFIPPAANMAAP